MTGDTTLLVGPRFAAEGGDAAALEVDGEGRIVAVHRRLPRGGRRRELPGALALPGLHDAHLHVAALGQAEEAVDLRGARSPAEVRDLVAAWARAHPAAPWVPGRGWDQSRFPGGRFPTAADLAGAAPVPVALLRADGHAAWVDAAVLRLAGLDARAPDPEGGRILRDAAGEPTGVLVDRAMEAAFAALPAPGPADVARWTALGARRCHEAGLTAVHAMSVAPAELAALAARAAEGALPVRCFAYLEGGAEGTWPWLEAHAPRAAAPPPPAGAGPLAVRGVKLFADGALGSRGAALLEGYADEPGCRGLLVLPPEALAAQVARAHALGWQVAVHAIGDRGNRVALDAFAAAGPGLAAARPRVEHAQILHPEDLPRLRALGAVASMQPLHATADMGWAEARLGRERLAGAYAWRTLHRLGVPLAFGSDAPIEAVSPLAGLHAALTRQDAGGRPPGGWLPAERLDLPAALGAFTAGAAWAVGREGDLGALAPGRLADLTLLDADPRAEPAAWLRCRPVGAALAGRLVG